MVIDTGDISAKQVVTIARSSNTDLMRVEGNNSPASIELNSDFNDIINGNLKGKKPTYFYVHDLERYSKDIDDVTDGRYKYLNSSVNWQKYYLGTMVVPVGQAINRDGKEEFETIGFLCADSLSKNAFTKKQKSINIKIFQSFATTFAVVTYKYCDMLQIIEEKKKHVRTN